MPKSRYGMEPKIGKAWMPKSRYGTEPKLREAMDGEIPIMQEPIYRDVAKTVAPRR